MKRKPFNWRLFHILSLFFISSLAVFGQTLDVRGVVTDANTGETLIGVSVSQKGTTNGAITDLDGNYVIKVPTGAILVFNYVGFDAQEIVVNNSVLNVKLKQNQQDLEEVIVVGYGVQKKSVVTASIARVTADDLANSAPVRVDNALKGLC